MYVRLAFSVAAQLDSDVLIVDEVLAVGDLEFQAKSIGTMEGASHQGRTILFTSHNMTDIRRICHRCLVLDHGHVRFIGDVDDAIDVYVSGAQPQEYPPPSMRPLAAIHQSASTPQHRRMRCED